MPNVVRLYPSDVWLPDLKELCFNFLTRFSKYRGGRYLAFRDGYIGTADKPGRIVKEYHKSVDKLKDKIFTSHADGERINYHKIAALYILSFMKYEPFCLDFPDEAKKPERNWRVQLANEYFSIPFLEAVFKAGNKTIAKELQMDDKHQKELVKMLYEHKRKITIIEPLSFAFIIEQIEQNYFLS
jgi:hypothetical protein